MGLKQGDKVKPKEFQLYKAWYMMSPMLALLMPEDLTKMDIDDATKKLVMIKTQSEFSKNYRVSPKTLVQWNNEINALPMKERFMWMKSLSRQVFGSLYKAILKDGDAPRVKLWAQLFEDYTEKNQITDPAAAEEIKKQTEFMRQLAERK